jgi:hypothetical protein
VIGGMKSYLIFIVLLLAGDGTSAQFFDAFRDSSLAINPRWLGDTSHFVHHQNRLKLQAPGAGKTSLATHSRAQNELYFEARMQLQFNPSSANYADLYLIASRDSLDQALEGVFVRIGHTNDEISLFKQDGNTRTRVIDGPDGLLNRNDNSIYLVVTRDSIGTWTLQVDTGLQQLSTLGSWYDSSRYQTGYAGLVFNYTATRSDKFFIDSIRLDGRLWNDQRAPLIIQSRLQNPTRIELLFDEPVHPNSSASQLIRLSNNQPATQLDFLQANQLRYTLATPLLPDIDHVFRLSGLKDTAGNTITDTLLQFRWHQPRLHDLVFNELLADPSPSIGLPESEYIELYNRSNRSLPLAGYQLTDGNTTAQLPAFDLAPGQHLILCSSSQLPIWVTYGTAIGLNPWPSLNNDRDQLKLLGNDNTLIDSLSYSLSWWGGQPATDGGISLERIDPDQFCLTAENWTPSQNLSGGTPGIPNSVKSTLYDDDPPVLQSWQLVEDSLRLTFSRTVSASETTKVTHEGVLLAFHSLGGDSSTQWEVYLPRDVSYESGLSLQLSGFIACNGRELRDSTLRIASTSPAEPGDWLVEEILFEPRTPNASFVELRNASKRYLNAGELILANPSEFGPINQSPLHEGLQLIAPGDRIWLSRNTEGVKSDYPLHGNNYLSLLRWPSMPQAGGEMGLYRLDETELVRWKYHPDQHFSLLRETKGISLERISSSGEVFWHSASATVGATPGLPNTQQPIGIAADSHVNPLVKHFTPDGDGSNDLLPICWDGVKAGAMLKMNLFSAEGLFIKNLANQVLMGERECLYWDGTDESGRQSAEGRYLLVGEYFWLNGERKSFKHVISLSRRN